MAANGKLDILKQQLTRFNDFINKLQTQFLTEKRLLATDVKQIKNRLIIIEPSLKQFIDIYSNINNVSESNVAALTEFETNYFDVLVKAQTLLESVSPVSLTNDYGDSHTNPKWEPFRLPLIQIQSFSGDLNEWLNFKSLFSSLIQENNQIADVQKFQYLKTLLKGKAAEVIKNLPLSSENYVVAWQLINDRFSNDKVLVHNLVKSLFNLDPVHKETPTKFRALIDTAKKTLRSLDTLLSREEQRDAFLFYLLTSKLDFNTIKDLESYSASSEESQVDIIMDFLENRSILLETIEQRKHISEKPGHRSLAVGSTSCPCCSGSHLLFFCEKFKRLSVADRSDKVGQFKCCVNCLRKGHFVQNCPTKSVCHFCYGKHHSLINNDFTHTNGEPRKRPYMSTDIVEPSTSKKVDDEPSTSSFVSNFANPGTNSYGLNGTVLMPTALVNVSGAPKHKKVVRALLDTGSTCYLITELCDSLKLLKYSVDLPLIGIGNITSSVKHRCTLYLRSRVNSFKIKIMCLVLPQITASLPSCNLETSSFNIPSNIQLADPEFDTPSSVDLLLSTQVFWSLLLPDQQELGENLPLLQNTRLGWVIAGGFPFLSNGLHCKFVSNYSDNSDTNTQKLKFWEVEEVGETVVGPSNLHPCEINFLENTIKNADNRFVVALPLKDNPSTLGDTFTIAKHRFFP